MAFNYATTCCNQIMANMGHSALGGCLYDFGNALRDAGLAAARAKRTAARRSSTNSHGRAQTSYLKPNSAGGVHSIQQYELIESLGEGDHCGDHHSDDSDTSSSGDPFDVLASIAPHLDGNFFWRCFSFSRNFGFALVNHELGDRFPSARNNVRCNQFLKTGNRDFLQPLADFICVETHNFCALIQVAKRLGKILSDERAERTTVSAVMVNSRD